MLKIMFCLLIFYDFLSKFDQNFQELSLLLEPELFHRLRLKSPAQVGSGSKTLFRTNLLLGSIQKFLLIIINIVIMILFEEKKNNNNNFSIFYSFPPLINLLKYFQNWHDFVFLAVFKKNLKVYNLRISVVEPN